MPTLTPIATGDKPNYDVTISDGSNSLGILIGGPQGFNPQAIRRVPRGAGAERKRIEQKDWTGGRGNYIYSSDQSRFFDSGALWSMTPGQAISGPLWRYSKAPWRTHYMRWPMDWTGYSLLPILSGYSRVALYGATRYIYTKITPGSLVFRRVSLILNRVGNPSGGSLEVKLLNSSKVTIATTAAIACSAITDYTSAVVDFSFASDQTLSASTDYYIELRETSGTLDANNYVAVNRGQGGASGTGLTSADEAVFEPDGYFMYMRLSGEPTGEQRRCLFFEYKRALYCATNQPGGTGAVYRNGDRGTATGAQTTSTLKDTTKTWTTDQWKNCVVMVINGTLKGSACEIESNTADTLTLKTGQTWHTAPTTLVSEYVILGSDEWTAVAGITLNGGATDVAVMNDIVYVASGGANNVTRFRELTVANVWTVQEADDGTNKGDLAETFTEGEKVYLYIVNNATVQWARAEQAAWGTNLVFSAAKPVGDSAAVCNGLTVYDDAVYIGKEDGVYVIKQGVASKVPVPLETARDLTNCTAFRGWNTNLYFSFMSGLERLYGRVVDDIGPDRNQGLPYTRRGVVADFVPVLQYAFVALDAGATGGRTSSILATISPGGAWHELFRAPSSNQRIQNLYYQNIPLIANRLWFQCGHDILSLVMPSTAQNPLNDSQMRYVWDSYYVTSWIDADTIELDHFFDELRLFSRNLGLGNFNAVWVDYQVDGSDDSTAWTTITTPFSTSPTQTLSVAVTGHRIRFRLRLLPWEYQTPIVINALMLSLVQMNEVQYDYAINFREGDKLMLLNSMDTGQTTAAALALLAGWMENADRLTLRCRFGPFDNLTGHLDPVPIVPTNWDADKNELIGSLMFKAL